MVGVDAGDDPAELVGAVIDLDFVVVAAAGRQPFRFVGDGHRDPVEGTGDARLMFDPFDAAAVDDDSHFAALRADVVLSAVSSAAVASFFVA